MDRCISLLFRWFLFRPAGSEDWRLLQTSLSSGFCFIHHLGNIYLFIYLSPSLLCDRFSSSTASSLNRKTLSVHQHNRFAYVQAKKESEENRMDVHSLLGTGRKYWKDNSRLDRWIRCHNQWRTDTSNAVSWDAGKAIAPVKPIICVPLGSSFLFLLLGKSKKSIYRKREGNFLTYKEDCHFCTYISVESYWLTSPVPEVHRNERTNGARGQLLFFVSRYERCSAVWKIKKKSRNIKSRKRKKYKKGNRSETEKSSVFELLNYILNNYQKFAIKFFVPHPSQMLAVMFC